VAKIHHCTLKGVELEAFTLFRVFSGVDGPASEFEFHSRNNKARWIRLARHLLSASSPTPFKDPIK
jgi:hypothetical protein